MFINIRSLYEAQMQNKIDKEKCAGIHYTIKTPISNLLPQIFNLMAQFVCDFKPKLQQQAEYQQLLCQILQKINDIQDPAKASKISQKLIKLKIKLAEQSIKVKDYITGLKSLLQAYETFKGYMELLQPLDQQPQQIKQYVEYKHLSIVKKIAFCAEQLNLSMYAIRIYDKMQLVYLMMKCYEKLIEKKKQKGPKYDLMYGYIDELKKYGNKGKVIELYQRMIDQFEYFPNRRHTLRKQLSDFLTNSSNLKQNVAEYGQKLNNSSLINLDVSDVIEELKHQINISVPLAENDDQKQQQVQEDRDQMFQQRNEGMVQDH